MTADRHITLFHAPRTRSTGVISLLEELGADYELHVLNTKAGEHRAPAYLSVNPMGKVPAIKHGDAIVTEQAAIYMYLADLYAEANLAPALNDPLRGPYLRWMVYYGSAFEPAIVDFAEKREATNLMLSPYGSYQTVMDALTAQLSQGPYFLGNRFTALDVLWGSALGWTMRFGIVPENPVFSQYVKTISARPAIATARAKDKELAAQQAS